MSSDYSINTGYLMFEDETDKAITDEIEDDAVNTSLWPKDYFQKAT